ncbi:acyl carrier protein [uncultured Selenomonas sp.]|uniref:acyl carrier protein n=1 Tax=uncultured Selenomonas sp. TaxID=159275 RepID=UPI0028E2B398|nr:acyl carrier protein [uncultured Selenomonas sp.]
MKNMEKYTQVFVEMFGKSVDEVKKLHYQDIIEWDSVGHMTLVSSLEDTFDIMLETDDIIDFESYEKGIEILKKYNVDFES